MKRFVFLPQFYLMLFVLLLTTLKGLEISKRFYINLGQTNLNTIWFSSSHYGYIDNGQVKDNLPDYWLADNWGNSTQEQFLDIDSCKGSKSVVIRKTNSLGASSFFQVVTMDSEGIYDFRLCTKGGGGQLLIRQNDGRIHEQVGEIKRLDIPSSDNWVTVEYSVKLSPNTKKTEIWLAVYQKREPTWFDSVFFGVQNEDNQSDNLLINSEFEIDGSIPILRSAKSKKLKQLERFFNIWQMDEAGWYYCMAQISFLSGNETNTIDYLMKASSQKQSPMILDGWLNREGRRRLANNELEAAQKSFELAIEINDDNPITYHGLAQIYDRTQSSSNALLAYHKSQPEVNSHVAYELALLYLNTIGDLDLGAKYLEIAEKDINLRNDINHQIEKQLNIGLTLAGLNNYEEARYQFRFVQNLAPPNSSYHSIATDNLIKLSSSSEQ